jgi:4-alpha-glucanotransferase
VFLRSSGVLLPIPCLPSGFGIGDLGPDAYRFADWLHSAGQRVWQILPLNPAHSAYGHSPYHSVSSFACDPLLISPARLAAEGLLEREELPAPELQRGRIDCAAVAGMKQGLLGKACARFRRRLPEEGCYTRFCTENSAWLEDDAFFNALSERYRGTVWNRWPSEIQQRRPEALARLRAELEEAIDHAKITQYFFHRQWRGLRAYLRERGIRIFGDLPIYVPLHSADVWCRQPLFSLDEAGNPSTASGVPPDYFSSEGQLWGHPVYRWEVHRETRFDWWIQRFARMFFLYDWVRIDHFRGLVAYWEVPAGEPTAAGGRWVQAPAEDFFKELERRFVSLPVTAEDLGVITAEVREACGAKGFRACGCSFSAWPTSRGAMRTPRTTFLRGVWSSPARTATTRSGGGSNRKPALSKSAASN